ncbi:hypothetical protein ACWEPI_30535 [Streptomyces sp. NPDC004262]
MSRFAEVIVLAGGAEAIMEPLTQPDPGRPWHGQFSDIGYGMHDGRLVEVPLPRTSRYYWPNHYTGEVDPDCPGILTRTDRSDGSREGE